MNMLWKDCIVKTAIALAILILFSIPKATHAQECEPEIVGALETFHSWGAGLGAKDDYVFIAARSGLQVVDASNPSTPRTAAWGFSVGSLSGGMDISGNYAYTAGLTFPTFDFKVIDISDPLTPQLVGALQSEGGKNVCSVGSYCYVAQPSFGLKIINVEAPSVPRLAGSLNLPDNTHDVAVSGSYAYIVGSEGMRVADISDPYEPFQTGFVETPASAGAVAICGQYAYVVGSYMGLQIIDISDPAAPAIVGSIDIAEAGGIALNGDYAYIVGGAFLKVVDISDPLSAVVIDSKALGCYPTTIRIDGSRAYALGPYNAFVIFDISDPSNPVLFPHPEIVAESWYVEVRGNYAYLSDEYHNPWGTRLVIADISDPAKPEITGSIEFEDAPIDGMAVDDSFAYICEGNYGPNGEIRLHTVDISNRFAPSLVGSTDKLPYRYVHDLEVMGSYAYMADDGDGLVVFDVSNPSFPHVIGSCATPGGAFDIDLSGSYACIAAISEGIYVVDISNPSMPFIAGSNSTVGNATNIAVSGSYLFASTTRDLNGSVWILDISDPTNPFIVGGVATTYIPRGIAAFGSHAFFADNSDNLNHGFYDHTVLRILDVSDPSNPRIIDSLDTPGHCHKMFADGSSSLLYMANSWGGLQIVDVAQAPRVSVNPTELTNSTYEGSNASDQMFEVWNSCIDSLSYSITDNVGWLYCTPDDGLSVGEHDTITVRYDTAGLDVGEYSAIITVAGHNASIGLLEIPVTLTILPRPEISFDTVSLSNSCEFGSNAPDQTFEVWNSGDGSLVFLVGDDADWMYCTPTSSTSNGEPVTVTVHYSTYQLDVGEHSATISIIGPDANNSPQYVDVNLTVEPQSFTAINLILPADGSYHIYSPIFQWEPIGGGDNVFAIDFLLKPATSASPEMGGLGMPSIYPSTAAGIFLSTYSHMGIIIRENTWTIPHTLWDRIPSGSQLYWRVRGIDLDAEQPAIINSNEIRSLFKM